MQLMTLFPAIPDAETAKAILNSFCQQYRCLGNVQVYETSEKCWVWEVRVEITAVQVAAMRGDLAAIYALDRLFAVATEEPTATAPTIATSHQKPQFQVKLDLKKASKQELKQQVLTLLGLENASQAAKWAKQQGMEVDLCYKSHWAAVLEKAQQVVAVAA